MTDQLVLNLGPEDAATRVLNVLNKQEAGLTKEMPPGAERLLATLVKRGLHPGDLKVAAALVLALDERREAG